MGVEFDENSIAKRYVDQEPPKLAAWMISKGLAKDVSGANKLQIIAAIIFFALAIYFAF